MYSYHTNEYQRTKTPEQKLLEAQGFTRSKQDGHTREDKKRLVDNIWVKGVKSIEEIKFGDTDCSFLARLSDHYPVIADIFLE